MAGTALAQGARR